MAVRRCSFAAVLVMLVFGALFFAPASAARAAGLPQDHPYQKTLRAYLATLKEKDFEIVPVERPPREKITDEERFIDWLWMDADDSPRVYDVKPPASAYTLKAIEDTSIMRPNGGADSAAFLASWDHPANPFFNSRSLRQRAIVIACVDMMMLDTTHEQQAVAGHNRSDYLGGTLIWLAYTYKVCKDDMPADARAAYETGLRKLVDRLNEWGPKGFMTDMDLFASVSLWHAADALGDEKMRELADNYCKVLYSDPRFFHPSGYFVDCGCFDASYNGISLYFAGWASRVSNRPDIVDATRKAYRLRAYLSLPESDGKSFVGPTHFSSRTSADSPNDQWGWQYRKYGGAMVTDEALPTLRMPGQDEFKTAPQRLADYLKLAAWPPKPAEDQPPKPAEPSSKPWEAYHWTSLNYAAAYYKPGFYARLQQLRAEKPDALKPPFTREGKFIERFGDVFLIAKRTGFGAIIHTGPVSIDDGRWHRPMGLSGGALSAFWTPATGPVILGRRRGIQGRTFDTYEEWRTWPTHAITGATDKGLTVSSARTMEPKATYDVRENSATVKVEGVMKKTSDQGLPIMPWIDPVAPRGPDSPPATQVLTGEVTYTRTFALDDTGLTITSSFTGDGKDRLAELYEVLPIYLGDSYDARPATEPAVRILFRTADQWADATTKPTDGVNAIRVERKKGAIDITLAKPARVRLSPTNWVDGYFSSATLRNVMIDLLERSNTTGSVSYRITPTDAAPAVAK